MGKMILIFCRPLDIIKEERSITVYMLTCNIPQWDWMYIHLRAVSPIPDSMITLMEAYRKEFPTATVLPKSAYFG